MEVKIMLTNGFVTGVNYWASNAGIKMWSDFDEKAIDSDFAKIASLKMDIVRLSLFGAIFNPFINFMVVAEA